MKPTKEQYLLAAKLEGLELEFDEDDSYPYRIEREDGHVTRIPWSPENPHTDAFSLLCAIQKYSDEHPRSWDELSDSLKEAWILMDRCIKTGPNVAAQAIFNLAVEIGKTMEQEK